MASKKELGQWQQRMQPAINRWVEESTDSDNDDFRFPKKIPKLLLIQVDGPKSTGEEIDQWAAEGEDALGLWLLKKNSLIVALL